MRTSNEPKKFCATKFTKDTKFSVVSALFTVTVCSLPIECRSFYAATASGRDTVTALSFFVFFVSFVVTLFVALWLPRAT